MTFMLRIQLFQIPTVLRMSKLPEFSGGPICLYVTVYPRVKCPSASIITWPVKMSFESLIV